MRLPGSHNSKDGAWAEVTVARQSGAACTMEELEAWVAPIAYQSNPYLAAAADAQFKPPMDVEAELAAMREGNIHDTQLKVMASLMNSGNTTEEAVGIVLEASHRVARPDWDWEREERDLRRMGEDWERKHPNVVSLRARRQEKADEGEAKRKKKEKNVHVVLGKAVEAAVRARGDDLMTVGELVWRCRAGLWESMTGAAARAWLDVEIERACRELRLASANRVVSEARSWILRDPDLARATVAWDEHGGIPTRSGLLDPVSRGLRPMKGEDFATHRVEAEYRPGADCPWWRTLLSDVFEGDEGAIGFLQEAVGAALINRKPRSMTRAVVFVGDSNSGKSSVMTTIAGLLSDDVNATPFDQLENPHGNTKFLQRSPWILHEAFDQSKWHSTAMVKAILSGDPINVNIKNGPMVTTVYRGAVFWGANTSPQFKESTKAIESRVKQVNCHRTFDQLHPVGASREAQRLGYDGAAQMILATERSGMLNWALDGWVRLSARGGFVDTPEMADAARAMRRDSNLAMAFIEECVTFNPDRMVGRPDFYGAYTAWWHENRGEGGRPPGADALGRAIASLYDARIGTDKKDLIGPGGVRFYAGVELNEAGLDLWSAASAEAASRGSSARLSGSAGEVNRVVPDNWKWRPSITRMRRAHRR